MKNMTIEIVPYFDDNFSYLIHCNRSKKTALVDCGDFGPVHQRLQEKGWFLENDEGGELNFRQSYDTTSDKLTTRPATAAL